MLGALIQFFPKYWRSNMPPLFPSVLLEMWFTTSDYLSIISPIKAVNSSLLSHSLKKKYWLFKNVLWDHWQIWNGLFKLLWLQLFYHFAWSNIDAGMYNAVLPFHPSSMVVSDNWLFGSVLEMQVSGTQSALQTVQQSDPEVHRTITLETERKLKSNLQNTHLVTAVLTWAMIGEISTILNSITILSWKLLDSVKKIAHFETYSMSIVGKKKNKQTGKL